VVGVTRTFAIDVLEEKRNAFEWAVRQSARSSRSRLVVKRVNHRVELGIQLLDALDRLLHQLSRRDLSLANKLRLGGCVECRQIFSHRSSSCVLALSVGRGDLCMLAALDERLWACGGGSAPGCIPWRRARRFPLLRDDLAHS
jgi:hypothetical protein